MGSNPGSSRCRVAGGWVEIAAMGCGSSLQHQGQSKGQGQGQPSKGKRGGRASVIEAEAGLACLEINAFSEKKQLGDEAMNFSRPFFFRIGFFFPWKKNLFYQTKSDPKGPDVLRVETYLRVPF